MLAPHDCLTDSDAAPAALERAAPAAPTWFEAPSPWGVLRLALSDPARRANHAVDAAIALQHHAALLDALDDWCAHDIAWSWITPPASSLPLATHVWVDGQLDGAETGPATLRLELPWALLRFLPAPADALARHLHWPAVPTAVVASRLHLDAQELGALEPGGAVVLPESMRMPWHGVLRAADEPAVAGLGVAIESPTPWAPRVADRGRTTPAIELPDPARPLTCEVRMATAHAFGADRLAGWAAGALGEVGPHATLWLCGGESEPARYLASGRLMPWGEGWALALEAVYESSDEEATTIL